MPSTDRSAARDEIPFSHSATTMTVSELRDALTGLPDDAIVLVAVPERPDEEWSTLQPLAGLGDPASRPAPPGYRTWLAPGATTVAVLRTTLPTGTYLVPRRGWLTVHHDLADEAVTDLHDQLLEVIESAARAVGHGGPVSVSRLDDRTTQWTWLGADVPVADVLDSAAHAVRMFTRSLPGDRTWTITPRIQES